MSSPSNADPGEASRRRFLTAASAAFGAVAAAIAGIPVVGALLSPLLRRRPALDKGLLAAAALADLPSGVPQRVELRTTVIDGWTRAEGVVGSVWLLKREDGSVSALSTICPHSGCSINLAGGVGYSCPCHTSAFGLSGEARSGPSPRPMDALEVQVREQHVFVRYARFRVGVKSREEI